jgi:hypothetical protein
VLALLANADAVRSRLQGMCADRRAANAMRRVLSTLREGRVRLPTSAAAVNPRTGWSVSFDEKVRLRLLARRRAQCFVHTAHKPL